MKVFTQCLLKNCVWCERLGQGLLLFWNLDQVKKQSYLLFQFSWSTIQKVDKGTNE